MEALLLGGNNMSTVTINVIDYTNDPFGRYQSDGEGNGAEFRDNYIVPELEKGNDLIINLDGILDDEYNSSFLDEAFANLIRKKGYKYSELCKRLKFKSVNKEWEKEAQSYLDELKDK
ncbi:STAS-like domain-containing protein [Thalassotalea sp. PLHSN55]|uniref:STAS-like domain-containing protein n=1 Tax=Thalassotalea sp. PLHSN55 TaxID=3435888 RepID=UPI003F87CF81